MDTVTLTIDGRPVTVEKGKTVLQAAIENGISVPYYCYHPGISIDGSCRVCIVKIEKMPKLQTSCSTICTEGMVIQTRTQEVVDARAGVFEFLLINHPLDCPVCDKGGECPLQNQAMTNGRGESRFTEIKRTYPKPINISAEVLLDRERCVLCARCTRFSEQIAGDPFIALIERGALRPASWPEALTVAAEKLTAARGNAAVLTGGRLTLEDSYAYAKFARVALGTNDIDFRARPHSTEEADFLAAAVAGTGLGTTF